MAEYPLAIDYPAHYTNILLGINRPKVIVLHTPEEPADGYMGTPVWFSNPNVGGSTHYFTSTYGFVVQCVPEVRRAIANGVTVPSRPYPADTDPSISLNGQSLSIEIEGYAASIGQTITPAQKNATAQLIAYMCSKYGIPADRAHIIGHYEVANNRSDPGTLNIDELIQMVKVILGQGQPPITKEWDEMATVEQIKQAYKEANEELWAEGKKGSDIHHALFDGIPRPAVTHVPGVMPEPNQKWRRLDNLTALSEMINRVTGYRVQAEHLAQWGLPDDPRIVGQDLLIELLVRARDAARVMTQQSPVLNPGEKAALAKFRANQTMTNVEKTQLMVALSRIVL